MRRRAGGSGLRKRNTAYRQCGVLNSGKRAAHIQTGTTIAWHGRSLGLNSAERRGIPDRHCRTGGLAVKERSEEGLLSTRNEEREAGLPWRSYAQSVCRLRDRSKRVGSTVESCSISFDRRGLDTFQAAEQLFPRELLYLARHSLALQDPILFFGSPPAFFGASLHPSKSSQSVHTRLRATRWNRMFRVMFASKPQILCERTSL